MECAQVLHHRRERRACPLLLLLLLLQLLLLLLIPIIDTTLVTFLRKFHGRRVSRGGRDHTSHRLVALGLSERGAAFTLWMLAAVSGGLAVSWGQIQLFDICSRKSPGPHLTAPAVPATGRGFRRTRRC